MFNVNKVPYEISLWEDIKKYEICEFDKTAKQCKYRIVDDLENLELKENESIVESIVNSFYTEEKIATIGSNTMTSPISIHEPVFTEKINGEINLSFYLNYNYYDEEDGVIKKNPFVNLLCNERKVKVGFKRDIFNEDFEWFDFIIKDIVEDSESKKITYNATGLFINELSKTGFELIFDAELENGQGTAEELIERTLKGSDWQLGSSDILVEKNIEVLYPITLMKSIDTYKDSSGNSRYEIIKTIDGTKIEDIEDIKAIKQIYVFYNVLSQKSSFFQFLYFGDLEEKDIQLLLDEDGVVIDEENKYSYHIEGFNEWKAIKEENSLNIPDFADGDKLEPSNTIPRGERIIRRQKTILDPNIDKYVTIYTKNDGEDKLYRYIDTVYGTSATVENLLINGYLFNNSSGWEGQESVDYVTVGLNEKNKEDEEPCLKFNLSKSNFILNTGLNENRNKIKDFKNGSKYVIKWRKTEGTENLKVIIGSYTLNDNKEYAIKSFCETSIDNEKGTKVVTLNITEENFSINNSTTKVGFFVKNTDEYNDKIILFKELQFFEYYENENGEKDEEGNIVPVIPGDKTTSKIEYRYIFYNPEINKDVTKIEDLKEAKIYYEENQCPSGYNISYDSNFNKNRAISISESNRFNIIQTICENFECWVDFVIGHDSNGKIKTSQTYEEVTLDELDDNDYCFEKNDDTAEPKLKKNISSSSQEPNQIYYRRINKPEKKVNIKQYITKENQAGFKYGINLKSIQRNINSEEITSKVIVKDNSNDYAENGSCSITRAIDSPTKENFLYNFDYYIKQGLISYNELNADLYLNSNNHLNYYNRLRKLNIERDNLIEEQSEKEIAITKLESNITVYSTGAEESINLYNDEIRELKQYLSSSMDISDEEAIAKAIERIELGEGETYSDRNAEGRLSAVRVYKKRYEEYEKLKNNYTSILQEENKRLAEIEARLKSILLEKTLLNKKFYEKYSRFIQEGSWISDDYMDDNLYYFDANSVLYTSSRPQISYTINVVDLSHLDGYENYSYRIGDKTFIEDTDFFGWKISAPILTPTQEEVIVSEYIHYFDTPENDIITIQNYKTKFEDLYQRITATSNSLQFHSGEYGRAASVIETNGTINYDSLQNSLINASYVLENAKNQSVVWDDTGITTTSLSRPGEIVRITSGAIAITNDGGKTWSSAITGYGINANYINTGQIDVNKINIMNGKFPSFKWTSIGLDAYSFAQSEYGDYINTNFNKFIRFDQYGIYGANGVEQNWVPKSSKDIIDNDAIRFSLTWDGLRIKNDDGSVQIDDKDDITVTDKDKVQRIKIGRLNKVYDDEGTFIDYNYGIRLKDASDAITMETDDSGQLWLRNYLLVGPEDAISSQVRIGYNEDETKVNDNNTHEIIHAGKEGSDKEFIVYEDGSLVANNADIIGIITATDGSFTGEINATSGTIGGIIITEDGLEVKEGHIVIYNNKGEEVFSVDEYGNLILKNVSAENSSFSGSIAASNLTVKQGEIGGFEIINEEIENGKTVSKLRSTDGENALELNGTEGKIIAENIELGIGAVIQDYIQLGDAKIQNPDLEDHGGIFISAGKISINDEGILKVGNIEINGGRDAVPEENIKKIDSTIKIGDKITFNGDTETLSSNSWQITPDASYFNNVTISGVLSTAVLEYGEVEAVGGMIFVRPSCLIDKAEPKDSNVLLTVKGDTTGFSSGDYCIITGKNAIPDSGSTNVSLGEDSKKHYKISNVDNKQIEIEGNFLDVSIDSFKDKAIICLGKIGDIAIGINSDNNSSFIQGRALSLSELQENESGIKYDTKIVLGDLADIMYGTTKLEGYGLYADNVYLKGSIMSVSKSGSTSGINTESTIQMPTGDIYPWKQNAENILIWAGSDPSKGINNSVFMVDSKGNLIANSCYLTGSIISNSTIEATTIRTATIEGTGKEKQFDYGLVIKDITNGIVFSENGENKFVLNSSGTAFYHPVEVDDKLTAKSIDISDQSDLGDLQIVGNQLSHKQNTKGIKFSYNDIDIDIYGKIKITDKETAIENHVFTSKEINYNKKIRMEIVEDGYDIYIVSE